MGPQLKSLFPERNKITKETKNHEYITLLLPTKEEILIAMEDLVKKVEKPHHWSIGFDPIDKDTNPDGYKLSICLIPE